MRKLSPKEQAFVEEYPKDFNASAAARRAGYSERTANRIGPRQLSKVVIQAALRERLEARRKRVQVEADHVLAGLLREAQRKGEGSSHAARIRAWELIGKHISFFPSERFSIEHRLSGLSDAQLQRLAKLPPLEQARALGLVNGTGEP